mmetsp:Transcript_23947/g.60112  ORF Transcript_23947/g.60112 Transcript_23947/m.60112 type:complete len:258 (-) Transcript_23947:109-882(-)
MPSAICSIARFRMRCRISQRHMGHFETFSTHVLQIEWPEWHWKTGATMMFMQTEHSRALNKLSCSLLGFSGALRFLTLLSASASVDSAAATNTGWVGRLCALTTSHRSSVTSTTSSPLSLNTPSHAPEKLPAFFSLRAKPTLLPRLLALRPAMMSWKLDLFLSALSRSKTSTRLPKVAGMFSTMPLMKLRERSELASMKIQPSVNAMIHSDCRSCHMPALCTNALLNTSFSSSSRLEATITIPSHPLPRVLSTSHLR